MFLIDYKNSYENLQRPFLIAEYENFIKKKETPLKDFFQLLKEYLEKWVYSTHYTHFELFYLMKEYNGCSICDIFTITENFSLKFNILYALFKMKGNKFYEKDPKTPISPHFQNLYDILEFYNDFCQTGDFLNFNYFDDKSLIEKCKSYYIKKVGDEVKITETPSSKDFQLDLFKEFEKYIEKTKQNENLLINYNGFIEYIKEKVSAKSTKWNFQTSETLKIISIFIYFRENRKNDLFYFYLSSFLAQFMSTSGKHFHYLNEKFIKFIEKAMNLKILLQEDDFAEHDFKGLLRKLGLFAQIKLKDEVFYIDYINMITLFSYDEIFEEGEYRNTPDFGKVEAGLFMILETFDHSREVSNKCLQFYVFNNHVKFLGFFNSFMEFADTKKHKHYNSDSNFLSKTIGKCYQFLSNLLIKIEQNPEFLIENSQFLTILLPNVVMKSRGLSATLMKLTRKFLDVMMKIVETKESDYFLERLIYVFFGFFYTNDTQNQALNLYSYITQQGFLIKIERIILEKPSPLALIIFFNIANLHFVIYPNISNNNKDFNEKSLKVCQKVFFAMNLMNIKYDPLCLLKNSLKSPIFSYVLQYIYKEKLLDFRLEISKKTNNYKEKASISEKVELFHSLEIILTEELRKLIDVIENSKQMALKSQTEGNSNVFSRYYNEIFASLITENLNFLKYFKKEYGVHIFPENFNKILNEICLALYNPLINKIDKGDIRSFSFLALNMANLTIEKLGLFFENFIEQLFIQFYEKGFENMDSYLITEKNYRKCVEMRKLELLIKVMRRFFQKQKHEFSINSGFFFESFQKIVALLFQHEVLDVYLMHLITNKVKKPSFLDYMTCKNDEIGFEINGKTCFNSSRLLRTMFSFLKSFENLINAENSDKIHNFLRIILMEQILSLEINETLVDIDDLFQSQRNFEFFYVNMRKHNLFYQLFRLIKLSNINELILLKNPSYKKVFPIIQTNLKFYLKLYQRLEKERQLVGKSLNEFGNEVFFILQTFYFQQLFLIYFFNDIEILCQKKLVLPIRYWRDLIEAIEGHFAINLEVLIDMDSKPEYMYEKIIHKIKGTLLENPLKVFSSNIY